MNLIFAVVKKDARALAGRMAWWLGLMILKLGVGAWLFLSPDVTRAMFDAAGYALIVLALTEGALLFLLAALLVREDAPVGANTFWRTRPLSGARLLAAKVTGAFFLLVLPAIVTSVPWWLLAGGADATALLRAAGLMLAVQTAVILPAMLMAAVTDSLGRMLVYSLVVLGVGSLASGYVAVLVVAPLQSIEEARWRLLIWAGGAAVTAMAIVLGQYLGRRPHRAALTAAAGLSAALGLARWLPYSPPGPANAGAVELRLGEGKIDPLRPLAKAVDAITFGTELRGVEPGLFPVGDLVRHEWRFADGTASTGAGGGLMPGQGPARAEVGRVFGLSEPGKTEAKDPAVRTELRLIAWADRRMQERLRAEPAALTLTADVSLLRPVPVASAAFVPGTTVRGGGRSTRVLGIEKRDETRLLPRARLLQTEFVSAPDGIVIGSFLNRRGASSAGISPLFLVQREKAVVRQLNVASTVNLLVAGVILTLGEAAVDQGAEAGATLALIDWRQERRVRVETKSDPVQLTRGAPAAERGAR